MGRHRHICVLIIPEFKPGDPAPAGYLEWHEWARVQVRARLKQRQCGRCAKWRFPQELSSQFTEHAAHTRSGKPVRQIAPICNDCAPKEAA